MHLLNLWLHILGFAVYLGSTVTLLVLFLPMVNEIADLAARRRSFARGMKVYNPLSLGSMGVSLMTGAFNLTDFKASLGKAFFGRVGGILAWKLLLVFGLILVATALSFGIGHRTVREELSGEPIDASALESRLKRLSWMLWTAVFLTAGVVWLGLRLSQAR